MPKKEAIQVISSKIGQYMWGFEWEWLRKTHMLTPESPVDWEGLESVGLEEV